MKFDISPDLIGELQRRSSKSSLRSMGRSTSKDAEQSTATLDELENLLQQAVADEDYEQAGKVHKLCLQFHPHEYA
jgi:protein-arginine kinase activator protein McsA